MPVHPQEEHAASCTALSLSLPLYQVRHGLATLGPEMLALKGALEARFLAWAEEVGASAMLFPPLLPAAALARLDYFRNFPHLALVTSRIRDDLLAESSERYGADGTDGTDGTLSAIPAADLTASQYVLPSAACYNVYLHLAGATLEAPCYITTVATCFRNENHFDELQRLWSFTMREIVCIGPADAVKEHLHGFKARILRFAAELGCALVPQFATDPFFQPQSSVAQLQKLFPQKEELVFRESLAIASLNYHRNFFGERCAINTTDGKPAFTGCVAFGLERWLHALLERFGNQPEAALRALESLP